MRLRPIVWIVAAASLLSFYASSAAATPASPQARAKSERLERLAQRQTSVMLRSFEGQNVSPSTCSGPGRGRHDRGRRHDILVLPVLSFTPGDAQIECETSARTALLDLGGVVITEDDRFPDSSYLLGADTVPFTPENLSPICDDIIAKDYLGTPTPATLDGIAITPVPAINSGLFVAPINRKAQIPGGVDLYADSVALGHPGRLATVFCGFKTLVPLQPGQHTIVVDYSSFAGSPTIFTFHVTVRPRHHRGG